jgi:hypothetical protein
LHIAYTEYMNEQEKQLAQEAVRWVRRVANKKVVIARFASLEDYPPSEHPLVFFTAGSPGAGKQSLLKAFENLSSVR